jgi:hypothetical protein
MATRPKTSKGATHGPRFNGRGNGTGNGAHGNGNGAVATPEARRIATEMGSALLLASSLETARHSDDVELIAGAIAEHLGLPRAEHDDILAGARLHDIGKASLPKNLLDKPSALTPTEWELMRTHTIIGEQILGSVPELGGIARLVRHSHERWDGNGYPDGLAGDEIPLGSRIIFCADAFHAIRSDRAYREGIPAPRAMREIRRCSGTQFDPEIVDAFEQVIKDMRILPAAKRAKRSSRLTALLLCLALGAGGSAVGRSDLLGSPSEAEAGPPPVALDCGALYCHSVFGINAPSILGSKRIAGDLGAAVHGPGGTAPPSGAGTQAPSRGAEIVAGTGPGSVAPGGAQGGDAIDPVQPGGGGGGNEGGGNEGGTSGGPVGNPPPSSKDKNPNSPGNGWGPPSTRPPDNPGPGNAGGNGGGVGGSGGSPGNSGNAPGHNKPPKPPK